MTRGRALTEKGAKYFSSKCNRRQATQWSPQWRTFNTVTTMMPYKQNPRGFRRISSRSRSRRRIYNPQIIPDRPVIFASCTESRTTCILRQRRGSQTSTKFTSVKFQSNARLFFTLFEWYRERHRLIISQNGKPKILEHYVCVRGTLHEI